MNVGRVPVGVLGHYRALRRAGVGAYDARQMVILRVIDAGLFGSYVIAPQRGAGSL